MNVKKHSFLILRSTNKWKYISAYTDKFDNGLDPCYATKTKVHAKPKINVYNNNLPRQ